MISTMLAIREATEEAILDQEVMDLAAFIFRNKDSLGAEEFAQLLFKYSSHLAGLTATFVTQVCLTESDLSVLVDTIKEMNQLEKEVE